MDISSLVDNPQKLLEVCEDYELQTFGQVTDKAEIYYSVHLIALLSLNDITNARFCWKRIPSQLKNSNQLQNVWKLATMVNKKDFKGFYSTVSSTQWAPDIKPFIEHLNNAQRTQNQNLIQKTYSSVALSQCADMLGLTTADTQTHLDKLGWEVKDNHVNPAPATNTSSKLHETTTTQLDQLTDYIIHLEDKFHHELKVDPVNLVADEKKK